MESQSLLVIDDDETFCRYVETVLSARGHRVVYETDARTAVGHLHGHPFDAVLLDLVMPELDGLELLEQIREHWNVLPVLVVTAYGNVENTLEAMRRGATDFVTKPVDGSHLELRVRSACQLERARQRANTDGLTGLYNHRYLHERLQQEIERFERYGRPLSLVMADLDRFKLYNDTHGHPRGDELLIAVAKTLRQMSRSSDVVGRYGGDEFTRILPETTVAEARLKAERMRRFIERLELDVGGTATPVTLSLGIATASAACRRREDLIAAADAALYRAKRLGRNRVCIAGRGASPPLSLAAS